MIFDDLSDTGGTFIQINIDFCLNKKITAIYLFQLLLILIIIISIIIFW